MDINNISGFACAALRCDTAPLGSNPNPNPNPKPDPHPHLSPLTLTLTRCDTCRSVFGLQTWQSCALDFEYTLLHMSYLYR